MSVYAKRMALLSARIFGEANRPLQGRNARIVQQMSEKPYDLRKDWTDWYPPYFQYSELMFKLRAYGLFRDEHMDFKDEMKRLRKLRGKGPPKKGEGKRAQLKQ